MNQGCIIVSPDLIANPAIFEALLSEFTFIRQLEIEDKTHVLILEHDCFKDVPLGGTLYFYDLEFKRNRDTKNIYLSDIGQPFYHPKLIFRCQKKEEPPKVEEQQETNLWPGLM